MNNSIGGELTIAIVGVLTTASAWFLGGKQKAKNDHNDILTKGANQIVESSNRLVEMLERLLEEERKHRTACEDLLLDHKKQINAMNKKIEELAKRFI